MPTTTEFPSWTLIHSYSRAQAIADGMLVEIPADVCKRAGLRFPTAITAALYATAVAVPAGTEASQDVTGRLWDLAWMLRCAIRGAIPAKLRPAPHGIGEELIYQLHVVTHPRELADPPLLTVKATTGPGDDPAPVMTLMLPTED